MEKTEITEEEQGSPRELSLACLLQLIPFSYKQTPSATFLSAVQTLGPWEFQRKGLPTRNLPEFSICKRKSIF